MLIPGLREAIRDGRERAGLVVALDHENIVFERENTAFTKDHERLGRIAHHHPNDGVIDRIGGGERVDIDFRRGEFGADAGERAWAVSEEDRQLRRSFDQDLRYHFCKHARCSDS